MNAKTVLLLFGVLFILPKLVHGQDAATFHYLAPDGVNIGKLLPPPPGNYTPETAGEIKVILEMQHDKTPQQVAAVREEDGLSPLLFCDGTIPGTGEKSAALVSLLTKVKGDVQAIAGEGKSIWDRPRPARLDKRIERLVDLPPDSSYPGTNATVGYAWAEVLATLEPESRQALAAKADALARDRVLAGMQYPSDIVAARTLGQEIARKLLQNEAFLRDLQAARREMAAAAPPRPADELGLPGAAPVLATGVGP